MSSPKYKRSKLKEYTRDNLVYKENLTDTDKPRFLWMLKEDRGKCFYSNDGGNLKSPKFFILSVDDENNIKGDKKMYESLTDYMAVRDKPIYLRQLPHPNTTVWGYGYFAEEVLEIIPLVLKRQGSLISDNDARLSTLRQKYKPATPDLHTIILSFEFLKILEEFDIDKSLITIFPDIYSETSIRKRLDDGIQAFKTLSRDFHEVMCPDQAIWFIFINCVGGFFAIGDPDLKRLIVACMLKFRMNPNVMVSKSLVVRSIKMIIRHEFYRDKKDPVAENKYLTREGKFDLIESVCNTDFFSRIPRFRVFMPLRSAEKFTHLPAWILRTVMVTERIEEFFGPDETFLKHTLLDGAKYFVPQEELNRVQSFFHAYKAPYYSLESTEYRRLKSVLGLEQRWKATLASLRMSKTKKPEKLKIRDYSKNKPFDRSTPFAPVDDLQKLSIELEGVEYVSNRYFMNKNNKKSENSQYFLVKKDAKNAKRSMATMEKYYSDSQNTEFVVRTFAYDQHSSLIFVSEGIEIIRLALKKQKTLTLDKVEGLRTLRDFARDGPNSSSAMPVSIFKKISSVFGVDQMITIVPDLICKYTTQAASENPSFPIYLLNTDGEGVMFGFHSALFTFAMVFCRTSFKIYEKMEVCMEFRKVIFRNLKKSIDLPEGTLIKKCRVESMNTFFLLEVKKHDLGTVNLNFFHDELKPTDVISPEMRHQPVEWKCQKDIGPVSASMARFSFIMNGIQVFFPPECINFEECLKLLETLLLIVPSSLVESTISLRQCLVDEHEEWKAGRASQMPEKATTFVTLPVRADVQQEAKVPAEAQSESKVNVEAEVFIIPTPHKPPPPETSSEPPSSEVSTLEKPDPKKSRMKKLKGIACGNCVQANAQCGKLQKELRLAQEKANEYEEKAKRTERLEKKLDIVEADNEYLKNKRKNADKARHAEGKIKDEAVKYAEENKEKIDNALQLEGELKEVQKKLTDRNKRVRSLEKQLTTLPSILEEKRVLAESVETRRRAENEQKALRKQTENENENLKKQLKKKTQKMEEEQRRVTNKFEKMEKEMGKMREINEKLLTRNLHLEADNTELKSTASQCKVQLVLESDKATILSAEKSVLQQEVVRLEHELRVLRNTEPSTSSASDEEDSSNEVGIPDTHCTICTRFRDSVMECDECHKVYHAKCLKKWFAEEDACSRCPHCQLMVLDKKEYPELGK